MYDRPKPANHDAEKAMLGAILLGDKSTMDRAMEIIRVPEAIDNHTNLAIWKAMVKLREAGELIDLVTLHTELGKKFDVTYLASLPDRVPSAEYVEQYARTVWEQYIRRAAIREVEATWEKLFTAGEEPREIISSSMLAQSKILEGDSRKGLVHISNGLIDLLDVIESRKSVDGVTGIPTGYMDLDRLLGGLDGLILLAARPSVGKTTFAQNIAANIGMMTLKDKEPNNVYFFSLEMSKAQLKEKFLAMLSRIDSYRLRASALMTDEEWRRVTAAAAKLNTARIHIDDTPAIRVSDLAVKLRRARSLHGPGIAIVDYLQLMSADGKPKSRYDAITDISRGLKAVSKEIMPVIALSQLKRIEPGKNNKVREPNLSDLRESGALEQDADVVVFLHRDDYESKENSVTVNSITSAIVAKNRMGSVGRLNFVFNKPESRFMPMTLRDGGQQKDPKREWAG